MKKYHYLKMENNCDYGLIFNYENTNDNKYCISKCCVPCPIQNYFYKENNIENDFYIINIIRIISCFLSLIVLIRHIYIYKNNEKNNVIIIYLSLSIFLFNSVSFFVIKDPKTIQCKDIITSSTQFNNYICTIQGGILIFSSFSIVIWIFVLILDFFITNVYKSYYIITNNYFNNFIAWGIPLIITFIILATGNISYEFSNLCLVSIENIFNMFFYPLGVFIFLAFFILIISLIYISIKYIYIKTDFYIYDNQCEYNYETKMLELKNIISIFKNYWRYISIGIISVSTFTYYWIFYYKEIHNFTYIFNNFIKCLENNKMNTCIIKTQETLPSYRSMIIAETLISIIGIWLFVIFININCINIYKYIKNKNRKNKNDLLNLI